MKIARELSLNVSLKELVEKQLDVLQNEKVKVVFYKEEGRWQTNVIVLQEGNTVSKRNLKTSLNMYEKMQEETQENIQNEE